MNHLHLYENILHSIRSIGDPFFTSATSMASALAIWRLVLIRIGGPEMMGLFFSENCVPFILFKSTQCRWRGGQTFAFCIFGSADIIGWDSWSNCLSIFFLKKHKYLYGVHFPSASLSNYTHLWISINQLTIPQTKLVGLGYMNPLLASLQ